MAGGLSGFRHHKERCARSKEITSLSYTSLRRFSSRFQSEEFDSSSYLWIVRIQKVQWILMDLEKR
jgi:hypothetical protein